MENRIPLLLILVGMLIGVFNKLFGGPTILFVVGAGCIFVAAVIILSKRKKMEVTKVPGACSKGLDNSLTKLTQIYLNLS